MGALKVNKTKITTENAFNQDHLWLEGNHESKNKKKKPSFRYFCWFMTRSLTLRLRKRYVYIFRALFAFSVLSYFLFLIEARNIHLALHLIVKETSPFFWRLNLLFCCCAANQYCEITGTFSKIFEIPIIPQILNINNLRTTSAKS